MSEVTHTGTVDEPHDPQPPATTDAHAAPVLLKERIDSIDVLRGIAVLGILAMNIQGFAMPFAAYMNPSIFHYEGANWYVWVTNHFIFDQKMMSIFSMLFGAGVVLMTSRAEAKTGRSAGIHYRRMMWLLIIGLIHAHLIWNGDILVSYAMCGLLVYLFRKMRPVTLMTLGIVSIIVPILVTLLGHFTIEMWPEEARAQQASFWSPNAEEIQEQLDTYRGSWLTQLPDRSFWALQFQTSVFLMFIMWRAGGLMLLGMALYKMGVFSAARSTKWYATMAVVGLGIGMPLIGLGVQQHLEHDWHWKHSMFAGGLYNYVGSVFVALAWVSLIMLFCRSGALTWLRKAFAAAGRMALTNYLLQSLICTFIFYGHGLGYFGDFNRVEQLIVVVSIWVFELVLSVFWLERFRFGPFEWLWRSLSYWRRQPMRRA